MNPLNENEENRASATVQSSSGSDSRTKKRVNPDQEEGREENEDRKPPGVAHNNNNNYRNTTLRPSQLPPLPDEVMKRIVSFTHLTTLVTCRKVNRFMYETFRLELFLRLLHRPTFSDLYHSTIMVDNTATESTGDGGDNDNDVCGAWEGEDEDCTTLRSQLGHQ